MKIAIHVCPLFLMAATICATPAAARGYLDCLTKKVIIVDSPKGSNLSSTEDKLGFWIDEAAKTIMFADGTPLIRRPSTTFTPRLSGLAEWWSKPKWEFPRLDGGSWKILPE